MKYFYVSYFCVIHRKLFNTHASNRLQAIITLQVTESIYMLQQTIKFNVDDLLTLIHEEILKMFLFFVDFSNHKIMNIHLLSLCKFKKSV